MRTLIDRMVLTILLAFAVVSPAVSEAGHLQDALAHATLVEASDVIVQDETGSEKGNSRSADKTAHCAFNHCAHAVSMIPPVGGSVQLNAARLAYSAHPADQLDAAARDGPEHPPRT